MLHLELAMKISTIILGTKMKTCDERMLKLVSQQGNKKVTYTVIKTYIKEYLSLKKKEITEIVALETRTEKSNRITTRAKTAALDTFTDK